MLANRKESLSTPKTLRELCFSAAQRYSKRDALNLKRGGEWINVSAAEFVQRVTHLAVGLAELGVKPGDRIALLSENRPEWSVADLAIVSLGAVNVPIYTTQAVDQVQYILEDSNAKFIFVSGRRVYKHARPGIENAKNLKRTIFFETDAAAEVENGLTLEEVERTGREKAEAEPGYFDKLASVVTSDTLATIIYTSGTTGEPKGVMLTHGSFISNVLAISSSLPIFSSDVALSVLPLSHIFERTVFYVFCWNGVSVYYAASFDQVGELLREVRPTIMTAVPRLFEKVYHRILKKGMSATGYRKQLFVWALDVGRRYAEARDHRKFVSPVLAAQQALASKLVFSKWREGVGGRLKYFVSGGASLSPTLSYSFLAAGVTILQGYGMTETCVVSANRPEDNRVGSVGVPFPGIDIKIAEDGEIFVRGANVMQGYHNHPEATAPVLKDGWFATGDVGRIDKTGHLYITDRKKDLFKLSNGKYVAPQLLESLVKQSEFVNQAVVVGAGRKFPAVLIVPDWDALGASMPADWASKSRVERSTDPNALRLLQREVTALTSELSDYERIRRVGLLPEELTIDSGELTPTLKVKRRIIDEKFGRMIDELYGTGGGKEE